MMLYFDVREDLQMMRYMMEAFETMISIEQAALADLRKTGAQFMTPYAKHRTIREEAARKSEEYRRIRTEFARRISHAVEICKRFKLSYYFKGLLAPIEGSAPFQGSIFELVLERPSDLLDFDNQFRDVVNQAIGALERSERKEFAKLVNPFYWIGQIIVFIVRLPYNILKLSGFDIENIEKNLFARLFQLLYVIVLIFVLLQFGLVSILDAKSLISP